MAKKRPNPTHGRKMRNSAPDDFASIFGEDIISAVLGNLFNSDPGHGPIPKMPPHGISLPHPRTVAELSEFLFRLGMPCGYPEHEGGTLIRRVHYLKVGVTDAQGIEREVYIGLGDVAGAHAKKDGNKRNG